MSTAVKWYAVAVGWTLAMMALLLFVLAPSFESRDIRTLVLIVGGFFIGYVGQMFARIGWYSR